MKRRTFLKTVGGVTGSVTLGPQMVLHAEQPAPSPVQATDLPRRVLGRTGEKLSMVGFPGLALIHYEQKECTEGASQGVRAGHQLLRRRARLRQRRVRNQNGHRPARDRPQPLLPRLQDQDARQGRRPARSSRIRSSCSRPTTSTSTRCTTS